MPCVERLVQVLGGDVQEATRILVQSFGRCKENERNSLSVRLPIPGSSHQVIETYLFAMLTSSANNHGPLAVTSDHNSYLLLQS